MLAALAEMQESGEYSHTLYLTEASRQKAGAAEWAGLVARSPDAGTGLVIFRGVGGAIAVAPPFPVVEDSLTEATHVAPLVGLLTGEPTAGVVLLRLGRYAVGVLRGETLIASKADSRYVKNKHRKGGSSQRRFERSRERLIRELFDKACQTAQRVFAPHQGKLDYVLLGGERHTLLDFERRCEYLRRSSFDVLPRRLAVDRPGKAAMDGIHREVWKSRVHVLKLPDALD
jgi:hypothetical protein